jgi:hypothetical protein
VIDRRGITDGKRQQQRRAERRDGDGAEAGLPRQIIFGVEIDAGETAITTFTVVDRSEPGEEGSVIVLLEVLIDICRARSELLEPVIVFARYKCLVIGGGTQLVLGAQISEELAVSRMKCATPPRSTIVYR